MNGSKCAGTVIRTAGGLILPLVASPEDVAGPLLGKTGRAARGDCASGAIPSLHRATADSHWRIPTAKLLDTIGVPYEFVSTVEQAT
jgi:hypothetical protein